MSPLFGFAFTEVALDYLSTIPAKFRAQVIKKAKALHLNPMPKGAKPLKGKYAKRDEKIYRIRSGDYRILYVIRNNPQEVIILDIGDRKDVYR